MWWKYVLIALIVLGVLLYFLIDAADSMLTRIIINTLKQEKKNRPEQVFLPLEEIVDLVRRRSYGNVSWFLRLIRKYWVLSPRHIRRRLKKASVIEESKDLPDNFGIPDNNSWINESFPWEDPTVYEWKITNPKRSVLRGVKWAFSIWILNIAIVFVPLAIFEWLSPWFSLAVAVIFIYWHINDAIKVRQLKAGSSNIHQNAVFRLASRQNMYTLTEAAFATGTYLYLLSSPLLPLESHFSNYTNNKFIWIAYTIQNIIDALFLDVIVILNFSFTSLAASTLQGRILMGALNLFILYSFVAMIIEAYKSQAEKETVFSGTIKDCFNFTFSQFRFAHEITCLGKLDSSSPPINFSVRELTQAHFINFDEDAVEMIPWA